jgi:fumarate hydratase class II
MMMNKSQSSNDTFPRNAILLQISSRNYNPEEKLRDTLHAKATEFKT